jgi:hypothetical protein
MKSKFIVILHILILGIMVGSLAPFKIINEISSLGLLFATGCLVLQNTIKRMLDERAAGLSCHLWVSLAPRRRSRLPRGERLR